MEVIKNEGEPYKVKRPKTAGFRKKSYLSGLLIPVICIDYPLRQNFGQKTKRTNMVKVKDYIEHLGYHISDPDQYLTCNMCNVYKQISLYRFRNRKCRLCIYLHRYRYGHTRNQFREHVYKYNIQEASSSSSLIYL